MSLRALQGPTGGGTPVGGSGTTNTIPRWTGASTLGDSVLVQVGAGIGLGTSTLYTGTKLQVSGSGGVAAITSEDTNAGGNFLRWLADTTNQPLINWTTGSALRFATSTSAFGTFAEWMRITSTGNVGIGTPSPNKKFQVLDSASGEVRFTTTANVVGNTITQRFSSNAGAGAYEGGGAYIQAIQGSGIDVWSLAFGTANLSATAQERARIDSTGNLILNTANTGATIQAAGLQQGIKLAPASAASFNTDPNTLDCYQENTWTPTLTAFDGTAPTATVAKYTRIGRMVYFEIVLNATGGANFGATWGATKVSLPFTPANTIAIPINRNSISSCGATSGSDILLTAYAQSAETIRITGFFSV